MPADETPPQTSGDITWSENACEIFAALARAQAKMRKLPKDRTVEVKHKDGGHHEFSYATLGATLEVMIEVLSAEGIAVLQPVATFNSGVEVRTVFVYGGDGGAQWIKSPTVWLSCKPGAQDVGSAITYAKRYSAQGMGGVAGVDDDGKAAQDDAPEQWTKRPPQESERRVVKRDADVDTRASKPRCAGKAAGLAEGNRKRTMQLAELLGKEPRAVWRETCEALKLPPDYLGEGPECPTAERLLVEEGKTVRETLDAAILQAALVAAQKDETT